MKEQIHNGPVSPGTQERIDTLNSLHVGVLVQGPDAAIHFSNMSALRMLGLTYEELTGKKSIHDGWQVVHEDGSPFPCSTLPFHDAIAKKQNVGPVIIGILRPLTNDKVWLQVHAEPILNTVGSIKEIICSFSDITDQKNIEEKLTKLYQRLESRAYELATSTADLQRFVYVATHDLQEPLRMVSSFTQLLKKKYEDNLDEQAKEYINYAVEGASRMKKLILDLLEFSKFSGNREEFSCTDMNKIIDSVREKFASEIQSSGAVLTTDALPGIHAKTTLVSQLFEQLVNNALTYHNGHAPEVHIGYTENEMEYTFSVKDNGIGIDPRYSEKIFILFQRLRNENEASEGTGVGLAICKKIVEMHRGTIWVESEKGKGSTFYFTIPKERPGI